MTRLLIFVGVLLVIAPSEIKERIDQTRERSKKMLERLWNGYDEAVCSVIDKLEERGIIRSEDYGTSKS